MQRQCASDEPDGYAFRPAGRRGSLCRVLGLVLLAVACARTAPPKDATPLNLILISIDTLRADRLGCYGYSRPTTPFLDRQARAGVLCADTTATSSWTYPSHASMFTGLYPGRNGATDLRQRIKKDIPSLAEWLVARGYHAAGVVSSSLFQGYGLERGFERLEYVDPGGPEPSGVTVHAMAWLDQVERSKPFFFLIHYLDPHSDYSSLPEFEAPFVGPYQGPATGKSEQLFEAVRGYLHFTPEDARHLSDLYDAGVRQLDAELEKLFAHIAALGLPENTVIVLTSDHGEEFLEHEGVMHGLTQYEESVRVPLLFFGPGVPAGVRLRAPCSLVDVVPTVLDLLGLEAPPALDGVSLRPLFVDAERERPPRALFVEADMDPPGPTARTMVPGDDLAVRRGNFKLVLDPHSGHTRLFDLEHDPHETRDASAEHPELARELTDELARFRAARTPPAPSGALTSEDLQKLEGLGYAGKEEEDKAPPR